ncbi:hypothetical protein FYJ36_03115 [[Clostridium] innocuum]|nr:hypothetical protein [Clostridioides difficile]MSS21303.1 hypothetical protein [[Clostridium] innocuum]HBQ73877.1 hypothetical protein [Erysipelotrichaceae bacterium]
MWNNWHHYGKDCSFPQYQRFIQWKSYGFSTNVTKTKNPYPFSIYAYAKLHQKKIVFFTSSFCIIPPPCKKELFLKQLFLHGILEIRKLRKLLQADQLEGIHKFLRDLI